MGHDFLWASDCPKKVVHGIRHSFRKAETLPTRLILILWTTMKKLLITIDGPAGAGKTTISKMLAEALGYRYVDTGALYRGIACMALKKGLELKSSPAFSDFLKNFDLKLVLRDNQLQIFANGTDITGEIRTQEVSMGASKVAAIPEVRAYLLELQKKFGAEKATVFEGRDMGTVVFPDADVKFFLTADSRVRALRRFEELPEKTRPPFEEVLQDIEKRDALDRERELAPLVAAKDAILLETSNLTLNDLLDVMLDHVREKTSKV